MDTGLISRRYAKALLAYARRHGVEREIYDLTGRLYRSFDELPALRRVLYNKTVSDTDKLEVLKFAAGIDSRTKTIGDLESVGGSTGSRGPVPQFDRFLAMVLTRTREEFLQMMCLSYRQLYRYEIGLLDVELTTAVELDDQTRQRLIEKISERTGSEIRLAIHVNPSIIGGYVFRWDTYRLDASVQSKLRRLRQKMTGDSVPFTKSAKSKN